MTNPQSAQSTMNIAFDGLGRILGFRENTYLGVTSVLPAEAFVNTLPPSIPGATVSQYLYLLMDEYASSRRPNTFLAPRGPDYFLNKNILSRVDFGIMDDDEVSCSSLRVSDGHGMTSDTRRYGGGGTDIQRLQFQLTDEECCPLLCVDFFSLCLVIEMQE